MENNGHERYSPPEDFTEARKISPRLGGWHWSSFCKTQYASDPRCGGVANFLRCHISIITLLDRIAKLLDGDAVDLSVVFHLALVAVVLPESAAST